MSQSRLNDYESDPQRGDHDTVDGLDLSGRAARNRYDDGYWDRLRSRVRELADEGETLGADGGVLPKQLEDDFDYAADTIRRHLKQTDGIAEVIGMTDDLQQRKCFLPAEDVRERDDVPGDSLRGGRE